MDRDNSLVSGVKNSSGAEVAHPGVLQPFGVPCYVLRDGRRILAGNAAMGALSGRGPGSRHFGRFIERFESQFNDFHAGPVFFMVGRTRAVGILAEDFARLCTRLVRASMEGALTEQQKHLALNALALLESFGAVGIVATIDEATGYQQVRARDALQLKLAAYLRESFGDWTRAFPPEFYALVSQAVRLPLGEGSARCRAYANFTRRYVYDALDPEVAEELSVRNPRPAKGHNHHQLFSDRARALLDAHVARLMTVLRQSHGRGDFDMRFQREFRGGMLQLPLAS